MAVYYDQYEWTSYNDYIKNKMGRGVRWYENISTFIEEHEQYRADVNRRNDFTDFE